MTENERDDAQKQSNFSFVQTLISIIVAVATTFLSIGMFTGNLAQRVTALEESNKKVEQKLDKIEEKMINVNSYEKDQRRFGEDLSEIKADIKELRKR